MEPIRPNHRPENPTRPVARRAVFTDFAPRRPASPSPLPSSPLQPVPKQPAAAHGPVAARPQASAPALTRSDHPRHHAGAGAEDIALPPERAGTLSPAKDHKAPRAKSENGHAGIIGTTVFMLLAALAVSPLLPGHIVSLPGTSQSFSSGNTVPCITTPTAMRTTTAYTTKNGFPLTYRYGTTETMSALCGSKQLSALEGHTSGFNPLGGIVDVLAAAVIAFVVAKVWAVIARRR